MKNSLNSSLHNECVIARQLDWRRRTYEESFRDQLDVLGEVQSGAPNTLVFVEHPSVLTLGANFHAVNLRMTETEYRANGIEVVRTDRGGDVTYHGPGQLVIYPIFDLETVGKDLHMWLRNLEETMLTTLGSFGISGRRFPPHTGAWIGDEKVAAIGIKVKRWVSMHGIALNCDNDLSPFESIVPCGIQGFGVTSLSKATGRRIGVDEAKDVVRTSFESVFGISQWA